MLSSQYILSYKLLFHFLWQNFYLVYKFLTGLSVADSLWVLYLTQNQTARMIRYPHLWLTENLYLGTTCILPTFYWPMSPTVPPPIHHHSYWILSLHLLAADCFVWKFKCYWEPPAILFSLAISIWFIDCLSFSFSLFTF